MLAGVGGDLCGAADGGCLSVHVAPGPDYADAEGYEAGGDVEKG